MTISERIEAARRERRVLTRVSRAGWRLEQAERERTWALPQPAPRGISIRTLATAAGLSPSRCTSSRPRPTSTVAITSLTAPAARLHGFTGTARQSAQTMILHIP